MVTRRSGKEKASKPAHRAPASTRRSLDPTLFADIIAIGNKIPSDEIDRFPRDGAKHFDEHIEAAPP